uniref:WASH_WAHD domain-containing protein n=1 Tax=Macrostomum lignano TaxID=282301 RepID=A0A1I8FKT4_9PLAT
CFPPPDLPAKFRPRHASPADYTRPGVAARRRGCPPVARWMLVTLTLHRCPCSNRQAERLPPPTPRFGPTAARALEGSWSTCPESYGGHAGQRFVEDGARRPARPQTYRVRPMSPFSCSRAPPRWAQDGRQGCELDFLDTDDKYSSDFKLSLDLVVSPQDKPLVDGPPPWDGFQARGLKPRLLVSEDEELAKLRADFMRDGEAPPLASPVSSQDSPLADKRAGCHPPPPPPPPPRAAPPKPQREGGSSFFDTLDWQHLEEPAPSAQPPISEPQQQRDDGPRDYEAEALRAAHEKPSGIAPRPKPRGGADCLAAVLAISVRRKSRTGRPIWSNPRRLTTSLLGWPTCWDFAAAVAASNGGLSQRPPSASLRQTQSTPTCSATCSPRLQLPAATPPPKAPYVVDDFFGGPNFTGAGHGNFVGAAQNQRKEPRSLHEMRHQARRAVYGPGAAPSEQLRIARLANWMQ